MAKRRSFIDRLPLAPVFALMFGTAVAIVIAAMPQWRFEQMIGASGLGSALAVAQPPLGLKARLLAVALGFALVALFVWGAATLVLRLLDGRGAATVQDDGDELDLESYGELLPPVDAPRRPIFAEAELGAPFMSDAALQSLAVVSLPRVEPEPAEVAPTPEVAGDEDACVADAVDTLETPLEFAEFDLPVAAGEDEPVAGESSIDTLIRRLEAGLARRAGPPPPSSPSSGPPPAGANPGALNPVGVMRDILAMNRDPAADDSDATRAMNTLQAMSTRRMAG